MIKGARATRIKSVLPEVQDLKEKLEEILNQQRSFLQPFHQNFLKPKEEELEQAKLLLQEVTQECLSYVEPLDPYVDETGAEFDVTSQNLDSKTIFSNPEEGLDELERGTTNPEESTKSGVVGSQLSKDNVNVSGASTKQKANETLQRGLKLLRDVNQSTVFDKNEGRAEVAPRQTGSVTLSTAKRRTLVDLSLSRTLPKSDTYKPRESNVGSDLSKASERRRLEMHANVLEQKSQMEIEKRLRELRLEKTKKQMEMSQKLFDLQAEAEIAEMESKKALEQHEMRLQIEEAEGSFRAPSICPSLMSLVLDEDKNSDIKSWLEQSDENFDKCFSQPKESSREVENKGGSSVLPQRLPEYSHQKNQPLPSQPQNRATSKSPQRKNPVITLPKPITSLQRGNDEPKPKHGFANTTFKVENPFPSFIPAVPVHQPVQFVQTSLPKLKLSEFHGDPLEWPEWSSLFTATIHNAPIDDNAKMSHLKILVKGKAKAAIAGLGYSRVMYSAAWNVLVTNFGRPQTIVNAQMKQIHLSPFIKSHDSAAIKKYAQLITTCVNVLKQFGFTGDLYSESVLNSALRKLPPELKTKWFFLAKSKSYYNADLCKFSEWLNEVAYVHDEMMVQFKTPFDKKASGSTEKVKTSTFVANDQGKTTSSSNKQCPLKDGEHKIWMCSKFKQKTVNERYEMLKKLKLCFCCLNSHLIKDCKSERVCGVNGCTKKHNRLLHSDAQKIDNVTNDKKTEDSAPQSRAGSSAMMSTGNNGFLQLIPISIGNEKRCVETIALCDTGSTVSFMDQTLVDLLRLKGKESVMSVAGIHGLSDMKTQIVTAKVGSTETETAGETVTFCSHPNLNVGEKDYDFRKLKEEYQYLYDLPNIKVSMTDVKVIFGQDAYHLIRPLEYKSGERNQPWAVKTALGWTISGALPKKEASNLSVSCNLSVASDPLANQMKTWWDMETYASVCDVSGRSKEEKRALSILKDQQNTTASVMKLV